MESPEEELCLEWGDRVVETPLKAGCRLVDLDVERSEDSEGGWDRLSWSWA